MSFITSPGIIVPPLTAGGVAYGTGSQAKVNSAGTIGQVLTSAGAGVPTWATASGGDLILLTTVNVAPSTLQVNVPITGSYSNYMITATDLFTDSSMTDVAITVGLTDMQTWRTVGGVWTQQTSAILSRLATSIGGGSGFTLFANNLTSATTSNKIATGTGYGYYTGTNVISAIKANSGAITNLRFAFSNGVSVFNGGTFKVYGIT